LIPIGLPGRPARTVEDRPDYSIKTPPLRDWKFDIAIKTKDVFYSRYPRECKAVADLHLVHRRPPVIERDSEISGLEATLPFQPPSM